MNRSTWIYEEQLRYRKNRVSMQPGDVIAFGGYGFLSRVIKWRTGSPVSHVGILLQTSRVQSKGATAWMPGFFNQIIESTSMDGFTGVAVSRLSHRLDTYAGDVWWLPLSSLARSRFNERIYFDFMLEQKGKEYDTKQAVFSAIDWLGWFTRNKEDTAKMFCSELNAAGLKKAGVIRPDVNVSEATPKDVVSWQLYQYCMQLKGKSRVVPGVCTVDVMPPAPPRFGHRV